VVPMPMPTCKERSVAFAWAANETYRACKSPEQGPTSGSRQAGDELRVLFLEYMPRGVDVLVHSRIFI
jgi:hypothetical protein